MHPYAVDSDERRDLTLMCGAVGVFLAYLLNRLLAGIHLDAPWWLDAPAGLGFASLTFGLLDRYIWKLSILRQVGLISTPSLAGKWSGTLESHGSELSLAREVEFEIKQSWTRISVVMRSPTSRSWSLSASVISKSSLGPQLAYVYQNEPVAGAEDTMNIHYGFARHALDVVGNRLDGEYFTGRGRNTFGTIVLRRSGGDWV